MNNYSIKDKVLALFFTKGGSLKLWSDSGILDREVKYYNELSCNLKKIYFFTYCGKDDLDYKAYLEKNIELIIMPKIFCRAHFKKVFEFIYSILLPFIHFRKILKANLLKTNQMSGAWSALIAKIIFRKKLIVRTGYLWSKFYSFQSPNFFKRKIIRLIEKVMYKFADGIITSSRNDYSYINENYKINKVHVFIPNYIDISRFKPIKVNKYENSICFVGRLEKQKNLLELLKSLINLPFNLTIIGNGSLKAELEKFAFKNNLSVNFSGIVSNEDLPEILNRHEIFILPSLYEGMPKSLLEAMACGLPVIGTDVEGINEIIIDGVDGVLCRTDRTSIRNAIITLMKNKELRLKLSRNARRKIVEEHSLKKIINKEIELYKKVAYV